jgi:hypothetical protein
MSGYISVYLRIMIRKWHTRLLISLNLYEERLQKSCNWLPGLNV